MLSEGLAIEDFLGRTASQLTYHGLCELNNTVQDEELCVFFRNNHFSTIYKHKGELFLLVTDQGFLTEPAVIWETLVNIEGDGQFVNSEYRSIQLESNTTPVIPVAPSAKPQLVTPATTTTPVIAASDAPQSMANLSQEDQDYLIALSLQQEPIASDSVPQQESTTPASLLGGDDTNNTDTKSTSQFDRDHQLALQLQEDEDRRAHQQQQQQQQPAPQQQQQQQQQSQPQQRSQPPSQQSQQRSQQRSQPSPQQQSQQQRERGQQEGDKCSIL